MSGPQQTNIMFVSSKTSPASEIILEEHLKRCLGRTETHPFNPTKNTKMPRAQHSCFGDFPKEKMFKKEKKTTTKGFGSVEVPEFGRCKIFISLILNRDFEKGNWVWRPEYFKTETTKNQHDRQA